jgi:hypothetical protein
MPKPRPGERSHLASTLAGPLLALSVAGCATIDGLTAAADELCGGRASELLDTVDWSRTATVEVAISSGDFAPTVLTMRRHRPYRLILTNRDATSRVFHAAGFFHAVALAEVRQGGDVAEPRCISMIDVPAGETIEARLMPLRTGRYEVSESYVPLDYWGSGLAVVYVE